MQKQIKPKSLQREQSGKALEYYLERYKECVADGDSFLSGLYLDEVVQSMLLHPQVGTLHGEKVSHETLKHKLNALAREFDLDAEAHERVALDISIVLRKRFPESYKEEDDLAHDLDNDGGS